MPLTWVWGVMNGLNYLLVLQQSPVLSQEHQSLDAEEFLHVHELGQLPTDHNQIHLQSRRPQHHDG